MAYNSAHTGPEIDAAVEMLGQVQDARDATSGDRSAVVTLASQVAANASQVASQAATVSAKTGQVLASATAVEQAHAEVISAGTATVESKEAAALSAGAAQESQASAGASEFAASQSQLAAGLSEQISAENAALTSADRLHVDALAQQVEADRASSQASSVSAALSALNAAAVVTGGTATIAPAPGKIPLADAGGKINSDWLGADVARSDAVQAVIDDFEALITIEPSDGKVPQSGSDGKLVEGWLPDSVIQAGSGVNLLPSTVSVFGQTLPRLGFATGTDITTEASSNSKAGFLLKVEAVTSGIGWFRLAESSTDFNLALAASASYIFSLDAFGDVAHSIEPRLRYNSTAGGISEISLGVIAITTTAARYSVVLNVPAAFAGTGHLTIYSQATAATGVTWFDGFMLERKIGSRSTPSQFQPGSSTRSEAAQVSRAIVSGSPKLPDGFIQTNLLLQQAIKLGMDPSGNWTISQGFTYDAKIRRMYVSWDRTGTSGSEVIISRHREDGTFELRSAISTSLIMHGQDLGHAYYNNTLYLFTASVDGKGITVFLPPSVDGAALSGVRTFKLCPDSYVLAFPNESSDFKSVVINAYDGGRTSNPYYSRIFDFQRLMAGADGDRSTEFEREINIGPVAEYSSASNNTLQSVTTDGVYLYTLTGTDKLADPAYLSAFCVTTGRRVYRAQFNVGGLRAAAKGTGFVREYEGIAWIPGNDGTVTPWVAVRMHNDAGDGSQMYVMPINEQHYGSANASTLGDCGSFFKGKGADIGYPQSEDFIIAQLDENGNVLRRTRINGAGVPGRWYFPENGYFGTEITLTPSSVANVTGINLIQNLGRYSGSCTGGHLMMLQRQEAAGGELAQFYAGTAKVGGIALSSTATSFNTSSDMSLKEDRGEMPLEDAYRIVDEVQWHRFEWKATGKVDDGVFAQELLEIYPNAVAKGGWQQDHDDEGKVVVDDAGIPVEFYNPWAVDYSKLVIPMGRALQGALQTITVLEDRLQAMEDRLASLENR